MKKAIIIGAGPAGITAAYELLMQTDITPVILEASHEVGGISRTINYKGNRIDIGGHRFFSKSKKVMDWWLRVLPLEQLDEEVIISYQNKHTVLDPGALEGVPGGQMMIRNRLSRILFLGKFFNYPLKLSFDTVKKLGALRIIRIGLSYCKARLFKRKERSLEDFIINRFGKELYLTFFKDYTEKVWGVPCSSISPEWGRQRIKGISLTAALKNALKKKKDGSVDQKNTETSFIEKFLYPKLGPGQLWETALQQVIDKGGRVEFGTRVTAMEHSGGHITKVIAKNEAGEEKIYEADYVISSMPVVDLVNGLGNQVPVEIKTITNGLQYRDFIMIGVLAKKLKARNADGSPISDNWIYIQEKSVIMGRLQLYNNWSPFMVKDENTAWLGLEYFCNEQDRLWTMTDEQLVKLARKELSGINIIDDADFLDAVVIRVPKTYPSYIGTYNEFDRVIKYLDGFPNLFLVGRNGMHKYNNQDHSMLTAMQAVENIKSNITGKENIWAINTDDDYHESDN